MTMAYMYGTLHTLYSLFKHCILLTKYAQSVQIGSSAALSTTLTQLVFVLLQMTILKDLQGLQKHFKE